MYSTSYSHLLGRGNVSSRPVLARRNWANRGHYHASAATALRGETSTSLALRGEASTSLSHREDEIDHKEPGAPHFAADFEYTTIAIKTTDDGSTQGRPSKLHGRQKPPPLKRRTAHGKADKRASMQRNASAQPVPKGYRAFEVMSGSTPLLLGNDIAELPVVEHPSTSSPAAEPSAASEPHELAAAAWEDEEPSTSGPAWVAEHQRTSAQRLRLGSKALGLMMKQVVRNPRLHNVVTAMDARTIRVRLHSLQTQLHVDRQRAVALVCEHPQLLTVSESDLEDRVQLLLTVLVACSDGKRYASAAGGPLTQAQVETRGIMEVLACVEQAPELLTQPADYPEVVSALLLTISTDIKAVAKLLRRHPRLLVEYKRGNRPHGSAASNNVSVASDQAGAHSRGLYMERFQHVLSTLGELLGVAAPDARALALREPALLTTLPGPMSAAAHAISSTFRVEQEVLRDMVTHSPELLCASPGVLDTTCRRFHTVMKRSEAWSQQLPKLLGHPRNLSVAISFDTSRYDRLSYLVTTRRDRGISYKEALTMPDEDFVDMYPGYIGWWKEQGR
mmetsp:Transcript_20964/g.45882  ORF Transcript_20964/g.45882 Transcript_20964/m.45882 type:complete len:563 (+) Transcript_20964:178-1866(+)|eukprot:CAMPEP_0202906094 /NCGR_PEP_ID=MMETSP1392-20130828/37293_1 /ASSEMBLY_ACC=CAM_ASM_000868 /TAXON_ID=225041 /ORGANISM="Chlamydomonas chlamydogama, Strain SAG 11-48b" /LENGTH=562 /DNA_ID=CAMNT_0049594453 /DNA_START=110 /DNA_END=1798 /DNA_ORIENTATION=-